MHRYDYGGKTGTDYGQITAVTSGNGDIVFRSDNDIYLEGSLVDANSGAITFAADGSIYIGPTRISSSFEGRDGQWKVDRSDMTLLTSSLTAKDAIELVAKGSITLDAAEITSSEGHIKILAGLGITIQDSLESAQYQKKGRFGKRNIQESGYQTFAIRSLLDAGKGINLSSAMGDITLKAVDIKSQKGANVEAKGGKVNLLLAKENDHYNYNSVRKGNFTTKTKSEGHEKETAIANTIVGGLQVQAAQGVHVEYEGMDEGSCEEYIHSKDVPPKSINGLDECAVANIEAISEMEGMGWMASVLEDAENNPELYSWEEIKLASKSWSESKTSLTPAMVAMITIAVAFYAGPAAGSLVGSTGGTFAAAAMQAGLTGLITQGTLAIANGAVDGGRFEEAFEALDNDQTWKNLAI